MLLAAAFAMAAAPVLPAPDADRAVNPSDARMPDLPHAEFDETLAIGGEDVDARKLRTRMTVDVAVNGTGPHRFVVDSGADTSVVGNRLAANLSLPPASPVVLNSITESRIVDQVRVAELDVGPASLYDLAVPVLRERDLGADGILGLDSLVGQRLMLDFEERRVSLHDASEPMPRQFGEIVVRARLKRGQLILTTVSAQGVQVEAVVDTGSELTIGNSRLRKALVRRNTPKLEPIRVWGVTGNAMELEVFQIPRLQLGPVILQDVPVAFADIPPFTVFGLEAEPALLLGTDLMETFRRVSLDFGKRKVRFQLRKCDPARVSLSTNRSYPTRIWSERESACES